MIRLILVCNECGKTFTGGASPDALRLNATQAGWFIMDLGDFCQGCGSGTFQAKEHQAGTGGDPAKAGPHETTI